MNYLEAYRIWSSGDESPEIYHTWAALSTISSFVSRCVWLDQGRDRTFLNLYVLFVGPAGNGKSTAMKTAMKIVEGFKKARPKAPESGTWQSLVKDLADKKLHRREYQFKDKKTFFTHCSLFCDEFTSLLQNDAHGWIKFLTRIYGCDDFDHKVKVAQEGESRHDTIENPYLAFLGCMTPDLTRDIVNEGIVSTGFNRRCVFVVHGFSNKVVPMRKLTDAQLQAREYVVNYAKKILEVRGPFVFGPNAMEFYEKWYYVNRERQKKETKPFMASWLNCKDQIILKVAMLVELGNNLDLRLSVESLEQAIHLVDATEANFHKVFTLSGRNPIADLANKIRNAVEMVDEPVNLKKIMVQFRPDGSDAEIQEALMQLQQDGTLKLHDQIIPNSPTVRLVATPEQLEKFLEREQSAPQPGIVQPEKTAQFGFEEGPPE